MIDTAALREKVLDLAIRGKLVPQDPNDEPASVLLERIRQQKQQMVKDGKLKPKDIKGDTVIFVGDDNLHYEKFSDGSVKCIEDEIPFEIPNTWFWVRLGALGQYKKGPFGSSITKAMFIPDSPTAIKVYEQKNAINKDASLGNYYISAEKYESLRGFEIFPNDIIVSCAGTIGETYVMPETMRKGIINQALMKISLYDLGIMDFYLVYFDCQLKNAAREQGHGVALKNIPPFDVLKKYLVPIPPIQEQGRILQAVSDLLDTVNIIDTARDEFFDLVGSIKSRILDLAIRGKLVPQNPEDEPAFVLLERIRAEKEELIRQGKIKRDKKESVIFRGEDNSYYEKIREKVICIDDELPFNIPESWSWTRFRNIVLNYDSQRRPITKHNRVNDLGLYDYYGATGAIDKVDSYLFDGEYLMIGEDGGNFFTQRDNSFIATGKFWANNHVHIVQPIVCNIWYLKHFLDSCDLAIMGLITGIGVPKLNQENMNKILVPIPPIGEQERIATAIKEIYSALMDIEKSLS